MKKNHLWKEISMSFLISLFLISLAVITVIHFRPLYYMELSFLPIEEKSGLSKDIILKNYNALIDYCSPFFKGELVFPTLPASQEGIQHFAEVKNIFLFFYWSAVICLGCIIVFFIRNRKKMHSSAFYHVFKTASILSAILPLFVGIVAAINFDTLFYTFHRLFFRNDYWMFDPKTDPIITILPEEFFFHCAVFLVLFILTGSLILYLFYRKLAKQKSMAKK